MSFNGLGMSLGNLSRLSRAETRSISTENPTGAKGQGGRHVDPTHGPSRELGTGWKVRPCTGVKPGETIVLADVDGDLFGEDVSRERAGVHRRVDLLAVGHQCVACQRVVMLPARQRPDAPDRAVDGPQPRAVTHTPDHAFVVGGGNLAAMLDQGAVGVEEELRVVQGFAVALVDADGYDHARRLARVADRVRCR